MQTLIDPDDEIRLHRVHYLTSQKRAIRGLLKRVNNPGQSVLSQSGIDLLTNTLSKINDELRHLVFVLHQSRKRRSTVCT
jgi:hypothetical protein